MKLNSKASELAKRRSEILFELIEAEDETRENLEDELSEVEAQLEYNGINIDDLDLEQDLALGLYGDTDHE